MTWKQFAVLALIALAVGAGTAEVVDRMGKDPTIQMPKMW